MRVHKKGADLNQKTKDIYLGKLLISLTKESSKLSKFEVVYELQVSGFLTMLEKDIWHWRYGK